MTPGPEDSYEPNLDGPGAMPRDEHCSTDGGGCPSHSRGCGEVTAETLTDEEIHELRRGIAGHVLPASGMAHTALTILWDYTEDALAVDPNSYASINAAGRAHHFARARVADAINARKAGAK